MPCKNCNEKRRSKDLELRPNAQKHIDAEMFNHYFRLNQNNNDEAISNRLKVDLYDLCNIYTSSKKRWIRELDPADVASEIYIHLLKTFNRHENDPEIRNPFNFFLHAIYQDYIDILRRETKNRERLERMIALLNSQLPK